MEVIPNLTWQFWSPQPIQKISPTKIVVFDAARKSRVLRGHWGPTGATLRSLADLQRSTTTVRPTGIADGDGELELRRGVFHHVRENNNNDCNCFDPSSVNGPETRARQQQQRVELFLKLLVFFSLIFIFKLFRTREEKRLRNPTD